MLIRFSKSVSLSLSTQAFFMPQRGVQASPAGIVGGKEILLSAFLSPNLDEEIWCTRNTEPSCDHKELQAKRSKQRRQGTQSLVTLKSPWIKPVLKATLPLDFLV